MLDLIVRAVAHTIVPLFAIGMVGSAAVVVVTVIRDMQEVLTSDDDPHVTDNL